MIDKLRLWTGDFKVEKENSLILKPGEIDLKTGETLKEYALFERPNGSLELGSKAYFNNTEFKDRKFPYTVEIDRRGLSLSFNPSLIYYEDHNLYSIIPQQLRIVIGRLEESLKDNGIELNIESTQISRIDLKRDIQSDFPFSVYSPVFNWLTGKRMLSVELPSSYSFRNKSRQVVFYDKLSELEVHGVKRESLNLGSGLFKMGKEDEIMRGELRLLRKPVVKSNLNIIEARELYRRDAQEHLNKRYAELMKELVFQTSDLTSEDLIYFKTDLDLMLRCKAQTKKWVSRYLKMIGATELVKRYGSLDVFADLLKKVGCDREYTYKVRKGIRKLLTEAREINKKIGGAPSFGELYNELYTKFLKVA